MFIRLTTPECFDALVDYLEKERHLQWPDVHFLDKSDFRSFFIGQIKKEMEKDTVFIEVDWKYDPAKRGIVADMRKILFSEIDTDMEYLGKDPHRNDTLNID